MVYSLAFCRFFMAHVAKCTIHGSYGYRKKYNKQLDFSFFFRIVTFDYCTGVSVYMFYYDDHPEDRTYYRNECCVFCLVS